MNVYLEALQDEHQLLLKALPGYRGAVERVGARIRALFAAGKARRLLLAGMGSSWYAARSAAPALNGKGCFTVAMNCFELLTQTPGMVDAHTVLVLITQSGNTPEAVRLAEYARGRAALTVAVLNEEQCAMRGLTDEELLLDMGRETRISNKTYYAQVALLNLLAAAVTEGDLDAVEREIRRAVDWHEEYRSAQEKRTGPLLDIFRRSALIEALGDGPQGGAAQQAGLVLREMPLLQVACYSASDYSHGWFDIARPGYTAVFFCDRITALDERMMRHCLEAGARVVLLAAEKAPLQHENLLEVPLPDQKGGLLPLYSIVPMYFAAGLLPERR